MTGWWSVEWPFVQWRHMFPERLSCASWVFSCQMCVPWYGVNLTNPLSLPGPPTLFFLLSFSPSLPRPQVVSPASGGTPSSGYSSLEPLTTASSCGTSEEGRAARSCSRATSAWLFWGWGENPSLGKTRGNCLQNGHLRGLTGSTFNCFSDSPECLVFCSQKGNEEQRVFFLLGPKGTSHVSLPVSHPVEISCSGLEPRRGLWPWKCV